MWCKGTKNNADQSVFYHQRSGLQGNRLIYQLQLLAGQSLTTIILKIKKYLQQ
jgi:hypothetical protein